MVSRKSQIKEQEQEEDGVEHNSQDSGLDIFMHAQNLVIDAKRHREGKRKEIKEDHVKQKKIISKKITTLFDTRHTKVTKIQKAQWNRLNALNKKREALETQIVASMKSMEQHSANISNELSAMFVGRKEDLLDSQPASVD